MGCPISPYIACPINWKSHWQILYRNIMHNLVIGTLQKCRINCNKWLVTFGRHASCTSHGMLLCNPHIKGAIRKRLTKNTNASTRWHRRSNGYNLIIFMGFLNQTIAKDFCIAWCIWDRLCLRTSNDIKFVYTMIFICCSFCWRIAFAFARNNMNKHRAFRIVSYVF